MEKFRLIAGFWLTRIYSFRSQMNHRSNIQREIIFNLEFNLPIKKIIRKFHKCKSISLWPTIQIGTPFVGSQLRYKSCQGNNQERWSPRRWTFRENPFRREFRLTQHTCTPSIDRARKSYPRNATPLNSKPRIFPSL